MRAKILIVDDVKKNIQVLGSVLGREGYRVSYALDGPKALLMAAEGDFDLILLDVMMPGMDGLEVCATLKENPRLRDIPLIFLTARTEHADIVTGFSLGAADYLTKPFNTAELVARVRNHLQLRQARQELSRLNEEKDRLAAEAHGFRAELKQLRGLLPLCGRCARHRDDERFLDMVRQYWCEHPRNDNEQDGCPGCR